jgi:sugar/nucleoside kinase (ribokinase family)
VTPELVVLGNLIVDDVVFADGQTRMGQPGGACAYLSLACTLFGVPTGLVSVRGDDYPSAMLEALEARGVDLDGLQHLGRPGLRTWLLYEGRRRQVIHHLQSASHADASPRPAAIPPAWLGARAFHLAPMPVDRQRELLLALADREGAHLSIDPYLLLRPETLAEFRELVSLADTLFLSEDELLVPAEGDGLCSLLRHLCGGRLRRVFFKRGARGGVLYDARGDHFVEWPPLATPIDDPTGAGDAFAAGALAGLLHGASIERCLAQGVVGASFAMAAFGTAGLLAATPEETRRRLRASFPELV